MAEMKFRAVRDIIDEPVRLKYNGELPQYIKSVVDEHGNRYPAQVKNDCVVAIISAKAGERFIFTDSAEDSGFGEAGFNQSETSPSEDSLSETSLDVIIGGKIFTSYVFDKKFVKPYLGPVYTSSGTSYTRLDFNTREHPHQRSVFIAIGDVNGIDFWNENKDRGVQIHKGFTKLESGAAFCGFTSVNEWRDANGNPLIDELRSMTFYNQKGRCRYVDVDITLTAGYCDVTFGATKEAGPLGIRVCNAMKADTGDGIIRNSYGAVGERECWSKPAHWCDYYGSTGDPSEGAVKGGITVFDNEKNMHYPTTWHVRDYGLMSPNTLFFKGKVDLKKGESVNYKYRIIFHEGMLTDREISDKFISYTM